MEIWKNVIGYEEKYQVSNLGNVKTLHFNGRYGERLLKKTKEHKRGYLTVCLTDKNGKQSNKSVHRLVAEAFVPKVEGKTHINHIDENKENNCVENLEWCDIAYNNKFGTREQRIVNKYAHAVLCKTTGEKYRSVRQASIKTGAQRKSIINCCKGIWKTANDLEWCYI